MANPPQVQRVALEDNRGGVVRRGTLQDAVAPRGEGEYTGTARFFHWFVVALLIAQYIIAFTMQNADKPKAPVGLIGWHVSIGLFIMLVILLRLAWRLTHRAPPSPNDLPVVVQGISKLTHVLFYVILLILPLLGWAMANSRGWTVRLFELIPLPALVPHTSTDSSLTTSLTSMHIVLAEALLFIIALHVAAAFFHLLVLRDWTFQRMLPDFMTRRSRMEPRDRQIR